VETGSIVAGLFFTGYSLRIDTKVRHIGNLLTITQQHREIWSEFYKKPELARALDPSQTWQANPFPMRKSCS